MKKNLFLLIFCSIFMLSGCNYNRNFDTQDIEGTWLYQTQIEPNVSSRLMWKFDKKTFIAEGQPSFLQKGEYEIIESNPNFIKLRLYNQKGDLPTEDREIKIIVDKQNGKILIDNKGPFEKTTMKIQY